MNAVDHTCHQLIAQKLSTGQHHTKISEDLSISRSLVFKVKKLLDDDWDLTPLAKRRKETMGPDRNCHRHGPGGHC